MSTTYLCKKNAIIKLMLVLYNRIYITNIYIPTEKNFRNILENHSYLYEHGIIL